MTDEQLNSIINDNDYEPIAKEVAKKILNSDRKEYHQRQNELQKQAEYQEKINEEKYQAQQTNPLYDDIHQMAKDIHLIKNFIIISIISTLSLTVLGIIVLMRFLF